MAAHLEPHYDRLFKQLEAIRWPLKQIPFDRIDRSLVSQSDLEHVRVNCCYELSSLYATRMFLRDFSHMPDFCQFMSIWYYEEMKHYLVLREYLKMFDYEPGPSEIEDLGIELDPAPWASTLAMHFCGELRLGMWYERWSQEFREPVLKLIYERVSQDEFRHANCYRLFMIESAKKQPDVIDQFLEMSKWMIYNPSGDKHPTTMRVNGPDTESVKDRIPNHERFEAMIQATIRPEDESRMAAGILSVLSEMTGSKLQSLAELSRFIRQRKQTDTRIAAHV